jgi:hypothetical protein
LLQARLNHHKTADISPFDPQAADDQPQDCELDVYGLLWGLDFGVLADALSRTVMKFD